MSEYILETSGLTKTYGRKKAVDNVDLKIRKGDIYGFVGRNGAGKTTVIKLIAGLAKPKEGVITLFDGKLSEGRKKLGVVIENPAYYPYMTARQNMEVQALMKGVKDNLIIGEILEKVGLSDTGKKKVKNFSLGMKQRLGIALALIGEPEFLILDEPINGLDPMGIREIRDLIISLSRDSGITVLISSHILGELSKMCTAYGVISEGKLIDQFTSEELQQRMRPFIKIKVDDVSKAAEVVKSELEISDIREFGSYIEIYEKLEEMMAINSALEANGINVKSISKQEGDCEDYFIRLMEGEKKDA